MQKRRNAFMPQRELADLYSSLTLFESIYADAEEQVEEIKRQIEDIYCKEYQVDIKEAKHDLHNLRNAGRKSKLTQEQVADIKAQKKAGESVEQIAKQYDVSARYIYKLCRS